MTDKNKPKKPETKMLQNFGRWLELGHWPKDYMTAEAGKRKPFYLRWAKAVAGFFSDIKTALKAIIKDIM